jgi:hypothetical protein
MRKRVPWLAAGTFLAGLLLGFLSGRYARPAAVAPERPAPSVAVGELVSAYARDPAGGALPTWGKVVRVRGVVVAVRRTGQVIAVLRDFGADPAAPPVYCVFRDDVAVAPDDVVTVEGECRGLSNPEERGVVVVNCRVVP